MEELNPPLLSCTLYLPTYRPLSLPTWLSGWLGLLSHRTARRWFVSQADELFAFRVLPQCVRLDRYLCLSLIPPHWKNSLTHTHTHTLTLVLFFCCFFFVLFCLNHSGLDSRPWRSPLILTTPVFLLRWGLRFRGLFFLMHCSHSFLPHCSASLLLSERNSDTNCHLLLQTQHCTPALSLCLGPLRSSNQLRVCFEKRDPFTMFSGRATQRRGFRDRRRERCTAGDADSLEIKPNDSR